MKDGQQLAYITITLRNGLPRSAFDLDVNDASPHQVGAVVGMLKRHAEYIENQTRELLRPFGARAAERFQNGMQAGAKLADLHIDQGDLKSKASTRKP